MMRLLSIHTWVPSSARGRNGYTPAEGNVIVPRRRTDQLSTPTSGIGAPAPQSREITPPLAPGSPSVYAAGVPVKDSLVYQEVSSPVTPSSNPALLLGTGPEHPDGTPPTGRHAEGAGPYQWVGLFCWSYSVVVRNPDGSVAAIT